MTALDLLVTYQYDNKCRLGVNTDGGYVIAELPGSYDCYISAGVADEESFSAAFIAKYNTDSNFAFDGSIDRYPTRYTDKIMFSKKFIGNHCDAATTDLSDLTGLYSNIFLKMDIEGGEYSWLMAMHLDQLAKFKQITIEFHGINDDSWDTLYSIKCACFKKLQSTHYLVHAHGNNCGGVTNRIPNILEVTYIRKDTCEPPALNTSRLPSSLDYSNKPKHIDIDLNFPPFNNSPVQYIPNLSTDIKYKLPTTPYFLHR
jgi:hypothetical protein